MEFCIFSSHLIFIRIKYYIRFRFWIGYNILTILLKIKLFQWPSALIIKKESTYAKTKSVGFGKIRDLASLLVFLIVLDFLPWSSATSTPRPTPKHAVWLHEWSARVAAWESASNANCSPCSVVSSSEGLRGNVACATRHGCWVRGWRRSSSWRASKYRAWTKRGTPGNSQLRTHPQLLRRSLIDINYRSDFDDKLQAPMLP